MKMKKYFQIGLLIVVFLASIFYLILRQYNFNGCLPGWLNLSPNLPLVNSAESFSVVVLPDTQKYSEKYPGIFCGQTEWIVANQEKFNIAFVSQLGDIVNNGGQVPAQWQVASTCLGRLDGKVPYGLIPGNHDLEKTDSLASGYKNYNATFPPERFNKYPWYGGNFHGNQNNYQIITSNNQTILFLNLELEPGDDVIAWAQTVIDRYPDVYTILTTHRYMLDQLDARDNAGEKLWRNLISKNCSIKIVWSANYHESSGENRLTSVNLCGDRVEQITQDYQTRKNGGNGLLRIYVFTPAKQKVDVYTYSTITGRLETDNCSQFTIPFLSQ